MSTNSNSKTPFIVGIVILALALIGALIWGFGKNNEVTTLTGDNAEINQALDAMTSLRDDLASEVDSLAGEYDLLASENVSLNGQLAASQDDLANAQSAVSRAKRNAAAEINDLTAQIEELKGARAQLQSSINSLQQENANLRQEMGILQTDLASSQQANQELTTQATNMQGEIQQLNYDNFKASSFQVTPEIKNGNPTSKPGRARFIRVNFDVNNVPAEYQGDRPVYLVITDQSGNPIPRENYIGSSVVVNGMTENIQAVEGKQMTIGPSQSVEFYHELEEKLETGPYTVKVYTDVCLLGTSSFRLR